MSILEIVWILATIANLWLIRKLILEDIDAFIFFIIMEVYSIIGLVLYWWDFLTTPLWG